MPTKKLNLLPSYQKYILILLFSVFCATAAIGLACIINRVASENSTNTTLLFILFLLIVSCCTIGYLYGIIYYLLTVQARILAEKEQQLSEAGTEKMKANLLRAISHDLRTPLTGIIGNSAAFLENQSHLSEKEKTDIVTNIYEDSNWLINMVENLLSITRVRDHDLCINTQEEAIEEVVAEALQKMSKRHPECAIHAKIPDEFIMLPMDAVLIEQVIINLLENALYHAKSTVPVDLIVEDMGEEVVFTVRDYGVGIPEEKLDTLFDGTGIGLAICKTIITAHHGTLTGKNHTPGAAFIFTLPKAREKILSAEEILTKGYLQP